MTATNRRIRGEEGNGHSQKPRVLKRSRQKEAIVRILSSTKSHPTAAWVYDQVRKEIPNISLATVYRNLRLLQAQGKIVGLDITGGCRRFEANTKDHCHVMCDRCGQILDVEEPALETLVARVSQETDFTVLEHRLELHGLCKECQEVRNRNS